MKRTVTRKKAVAVAPKKQAVDMDAVLKNLRLKIDEKYGSVNAFSKHKDCLDLKIEKSVKTILYGTKTSLVVVNKVRGLFKLPAITKKTDIVRTETYFIEE